MRLIGLLGGMSWESTQVYYRLLNQGAQARLGGIHSAPILLHSLDFQPVADAQEAGDWRRATRILVDGARRLHAGGADFALLCTNTMHRVLPAVRQAVPLPFIHIADVTAAAIRARGLRRVGLLGTRFTMEQDFYRDRLAVQGIETLIPPEPAREMVHRVIYEELCRGVVSDRSREEFVRVIAGLAARGAEGVVLGCTEIPLLVQAEHAPIPLFDTTRLHVEAALERAMVAAPGAGPERAIDPPVPAVHPSR